MKLQIQTNLNILILIIFLKVLKTVKQTLKIKKASYALFDRHFEVLPEAKAPQGRRRLKKEKNIFSQIFFAFLSCTLRREGLPNTPMIQRLGVRSCYNSFAYVILNTSNQRKAHVHASMHSVLDVMSPCQHPFAARLSKIKHATSIIGHYHRRYIYTLPKNTITL